MWAMTFRLHILLVVALLAGSGAPSPAQTPSPTPSGVRITYLANEGFLITSGETKVLIDALFGSGIEGYPVVPAAMREQLEAATGLFAGVDLVLTTHFHRDHFDPQSVARHLRSNPGARYISTHQAVDRLRQLPGFKDLERRVTGHWPAEGQRAVIEYEGLRVTLLNLHHGRGRNPPVQNLGFLIELGGLRLLHVGDTEVTLNDVRPYALGDAGIDVFFVPAWYFTYSQWQPLLTEVDASVRVIMHLAEPGAPASFFGPEGSRAKRLERILAADPDAIVLGAGETYSAQTPESSSSVK